MEIANQHQAFLVSCPIFNGPFDLLLFFIERDEIDILNIPISKITDDFLNYLSRMKEINVELTSEFILTAATLMKIKSQMLLPRQKLENGVEVDPRNELVQKILIFQSFKYVFHALSNRENLRLKIYKREYFNEDFINLKNNVASISELQSANIYNLFKAYKALLQKKQKPFNSKVHKVFDFPYSIQEISLDIMEKLNRHKILGFNSIFTEIKNRIHAIVIFLSLLELVNQQQISINDSLEGNNITIALLEKKQS